MKPEISVVITTYNRDPKIQGNILEKRKLKKLRYLRRAVASVFKQTFPNWELIIVDDASTDNTEDYCTALANNDPRVSYVRLEENSGAHSLPKNIGSKKATTNLIAYLDDDNWWEKDHLQALYNAFRENPHIDLAYCDRWLHLEGQPVAAPKSIDWSPVLLQQQNYIDTSDIMIRKDSLARVGGWDESLKKFADWNLLVRLAKAGAGAAHVPLRLSNYFLHEGSAQIRHQSMVDQQGNPMPTFSPHSCFIWATEEVKNDKGQVTAVQTATSWGPLPVPKVCIITVTWNREDYLKRTVKSMKAKAGHPFTHIIVNNGDPLKGKYDAEIIDIGENKGVPHAYNKAMDKMEKIEADRGEKFDVVVLTDNDVEFHSEDWLKQIVDLLSRTWTLVVSPYVEGLRDNPGGAKRTGVVNSQGQRVVPRNGYVGPHFLGFVTHMGNIVQAMPRNYWNGLRLNEETFKHGTQSVQIAQAAMGRGFALAYMENCKVEHMDTTAGQEKANPDYAKLTAKQKQEKYEPPKPKEEANEPDGKQGS